MSKVKLITVTNAPQHATTLLRTAEMFGWDYHCEVVEWRGFGSKLIGVRDYLLANVDVLHFVFCDAFDVVILGTPEEFLSKVDISEQITVGCEKGLWPPPLHAFRNKYPTSGSQFNFINSGVYFGNRYAFLHLMEEFPPNYDHDDQLWMNMIYLLEPERFKLDYFQKAINCHSFISEGEYKYHEDTKRIEIMGNFPVIVHKNGKSLDERLDKLVKEMLR